MSQRQHHGDPIVITGIGMIASVGRDRESVWNAVRLGRSGVQRLRGLMAIPDDLMLAATVDLPEASPYDMKTISLARIAAAEAMTDSGVDLAIVDRDRFGCAISSHMGTVGSVEEACGYGRPAGAPGWQEQFLPCTACTLIGNEWGLYGPRPSHSVACASGLIDILAAVRAIEDNQCDIALAGSAEGIHPLFAAGFHKMRVLADHEDPTQACRPFDSARNGFVMGEGGAMFVLERLSHARRRGATKIYAEVVAGKIMAQAHHVTGLDAESDALAHLITTTLRAGRRGPQDIAYINAHGTGTQQNDVMEARAIRRAFGRAADRSCVSSTKSMLGHLVNASGSVELAITALALRDGFLPPTLNVTNQDPECNIDCLPLVGRHTGGDHALKLSVAFGGHLAAVLIRRWPEIQSQLQGLNSSAA